MARLGREILTLEEKRKKESRGQRGEFQSRRVKVKGETAKILERQKEQLKMKGGGGVVERKGEEERNSSIPSIVDDSLL